MSTARTSHSSSRRPRAPRLGVAAACAASALAAVAAMDGCQPTNTCAAVGSPCGGDPTGTWAVVDACQNPLYAPPLAPTYTNQPKTTSREVPPEATSSDWCSSLQIETGNAVTNFTFPTEGALVRGGTLAYRADGSYHATITIEGSGSTELSASCLTQFGASPSCDQLAASLDAFAKGQEPQPPKPSYTGINCTSAPEGGCRCSYAMHLDGELDGRWSAGGSTLTLFDAASALPAQLDYCVEGGGATMTLWGSNDSVLFYRGGALKQGGHIQTSSEVIGSAALRILNLRKQ
jgi:hypothetical protein